MTGELAWRMLTEPSPRLLWKAAVNAGWNGGRAVRRFKAASASEGRLPPFLFISVTDSCNLCCKGCWVTQAEPSRTMTPETLDRIISSARRRGASFFGLLGGEPLLYPGLFDIIRKHPGAYFQLFTNGLLLDDDSARTMRRLGNVTPLISIEGMGEAADDRRGGRDVTARSIEAVERCRKHRLITGVASSICKSNFDDLVSEKFLRSLIARGAHYVWYYIYRPAGPRPAPELALNSDEILRLRKFLVDARTRHPILIVDAYWDEAGRSICPAAAGISHHISPAGDVEPCPVIQFSADNITDSADPSSVIEQSPFLADCRHLLGETGGCIVMRRPDALWEFLDQPGVRDTTGRGTGLVELAAMRPVADHGMGGRALPERHWLYRMAKRSFFFGFGAYG
jgi:MoaA/NifB/PqqE/SkfB family radical SAM enzyme